MNLNILAGNILHNCTVHIKEKIKLYVCLGQTNDHGTITPLYAPALELEAQIQAANNKQLQHMNMTNQAMITRRFYINYIAQGVYRVNEKGNDYIKYNDEWYRIDSMPDDYNIQGWLNVVATLQLKAPKGVI